MVIMAIIRDGDVDTLDTPCLLLNSTMISSAFDSMPRLRPSIPDCPVLAVGILVGLGLIVIHYQRILVRCLENYSSLSESNIDIYGFHSYKSIRY